MQSGLTKNKYKMVFSNKFEDLSPEIISVLLPGISLGTIPIPTGMAMIFKPSGEITFNPLVITFLVSKEMKNYRKIANWMFTMRDPENRKQQDAYEQATIQIYTPDGALLRLEVQFSQLFPIDITDILFESQLEDVPEIATVTFSYDSYKFVE